MLSAVYYLWATENLPRNWEQNPSLSVASPKARAQPAAHPAIKLIVDPSNATWVKNYWGADYLHRENIFYQLLLIAALTSYETIFGESAYRALLTDQVITLTAELEASPFGLLDDYSGQCYPIDVLPAIAVLARAPAILGQDPTKFVQRSLPAFTATRLAPKTQPPRLQYLRAQGRRHKRGQRRGNRLHANRDP